MAKCMLASIIFYTSFMFGAGQVCEPCEENTRCEIAYTYLCTNTVLEQLIWSIGGMDAAVCHTRNGNTCELYSDFKGVVFSTIQKQSDLMTTNIQFTADRNNPLISGKKWELVYSSNVVYTCDVQYYKKIDQAMCHHKISKKGLHIECTSANVYPKSCCNFSVKVNRTSMDLQLSPAYNHTVVKVAPLYFDTVCALDIAQADLKPGFWEFNVTMYPDIFNDDGKNCTHCKGGNTFLFNITIESPKARLNNCPDIVDNGKEFVCICQREDKSDVQTDVYWEKIGSTGDKNNISAVLRAKANYGEAGFICITKNELGWKHTINYNIAIHNNPIDNGKDCNADKPNNCFDKCYSDEEFCMDGNVYFCKDTEHDKLHQWCQTQDINEIQSSICKEACQLGFNKHLVEEEKKEPDKAIDLVELLIIVFIVTTALICAVVKLYRSHKMQKRQKNHSRNPLIDTSPSTIYIEHTIRDCFTCTELL